MDLLRPLLKAGSIASLGNVCPGYEGAAIADLLRVAPRHVVLVARDAGRMQSIARAIAFFAPERPVIQIPAWDCLPYDRVSPQTHVMSQRMAAFGEIARADQPRLILTTVSSALQRVPSLDYVTSHMLSIKPGQMRDIADITQFVTTSGFMRCSTVTEPGEFAVRGGIVDLFPPGADFPIRLDFFGQTLESIRSFDPETQRTIASVDELTLVAASELDLSPNSISRFRQGYLAAFGGGAMNDPVYEAVSAGARYQGMEHWLPLFHDHLVTLFDYFSAPDIFVCDAQLDESAEERWAQISDYHTARENAVRVASASVYRALSPTELYLSMDEFRAQQTPFSVIKISAFQQPEARHVLNVSCSAGRDFRIERSEDGTNVFDAVVGHIRSLQGRGKKVVIDTHSDGSASRLTGLLQDHGISATLDLQHADGIQFLSPQTLGVSTIGLEHGFETDLIAVISEQDILGDRMARRSRKRRADNFLTEAASLSQGDLVVHVDHGIGRFDSLQTLDVNGAPHACLKLLYHDDARLFLPVENIDLLSRFGGDEATVALDRLGGQAWQGRKARLKEKLKDIADSLIKIAAERRLREGDRFVPMTGLYDEFCAAFPFDETDDQLDAIEAVLEDLGSGQPMDRLICGDVGFGKTEVALRAAHTVAMGGGQVALIAPTTLLARQHAQNFKARFANMPVEIRELSRLISSNDARDTKQGLVEGKVDIVIGTHALLGKSMAFKRLGLVIIDEEQHFGVTHKERLKELRQEVHVLTLTATPIPRTLQMALTGVRSLSLIATPPVDRLAIRTYITPFDGVILREAILREKYRAGQSFMIVPRISDIDEIETFLRENVPEVRFVIAHGQLPGAELEERMSAFYDGQYDVLVSTSIIESGLDIPTANTIIIHRADMFGLAQLYQMRGRVGRSKQRAYAYLTYADTKPLTPAAEKRLQILQSLDNLGAGFTLASHDLDMRGAGNLVGEEQSGHIREVGFELYQSMLEEAIAERQGLQRRENWSPQINLGLSVMITENYVPDLELRMGLYRRLSLLDTPEEIEGFAAEMIDRFGPLPEEVNNLFEVIKTKITCYRAGIARVDVGPKGGVFQFRNAQFANPAGLIAYMSEAATPVKLRPDHSMFVQFKSDDVGARVGEVRRIVDRLAQIAAEGETAQSA